MIKQPQIIILLGRSGCGKGTQARLLQKKFGFNYLGTGELLRKHTRDRNFTSRKLKKFLNQGILVPVFLVSRIWSLAVEELKREKNLKGIIIDGSPRRLLEAKLMDDIFNWYEWKNILVLLMDISEKEAYERLTKRRVCVRCGRNIPWLAGFKKLKKCDKCGGKLENRSDDNKKAIQARMDYYKKEVEPVVKYYKKTGRLVKINGEQTIEKVHKNIVKKINKA